MTDLARLRTTGVGAIAAIACLASFAVHANGEPASQPGAGLRHAALAMTPGQPQMKSAIALTPIAFSELPGWEDDDHLAAWKAFVASCKPVLAAARAGTGSGPAPAPPGLVDACKLALLMAEDQHAQTRLGARAFFETYFRPQRVSHQGAEGLLTGYYEPLLKGSRVRDDVYRVAVYKRPADLVNMVAESERGAKSASFTHMRRTDAGLVPFLTRAEIEQGGLAGRGLELMYFKDPVDVFFMHIQGSGRVELPSGEKVRITYDGKNGYPYTSVGRALIEDGAMQADGVSLKSLKSWLREDPERGRKAMWKNESFVFFRELKGAEAAAAVGALGIQLQTGRSLAVDTGFHALGIPIFVAAPSLHHAGGGAGFSRLMIAHDVGSAIKGPERGDIYFGSGDAAGRRAGVTKHPGHFFVMLPKLDELPRSVASDTP